MKCLCVSQSGRQLQLTAAIIKIWELAVSTTWCCVPQTRSSEEGCHTFSTVTSVSKLFTMLDATQLWSHESEIKGNKLMVQISFHHAAFHWASRSLPIIVPWPLWTGCRRKCILRRNQWGIMSHHIYWLKPNGRFMFATWRECVQKWNKISALSGQTQKKGQTSTTHEKMHEKCQVKICAFSYTFFTL